MGRTVDLDDLCDANEVAQVLGLSRATAVSVYLSRYPDMPRPVYTRGGKRARLWLRSEVEAWQAKRQRAGGPVVRVKRTATACPLCSSESGGSGAQHCDGPPRRSFQRREAL